MFLKLASVCVFVCLSCTGRARRPAKGTASVLSGTTKCAVCVCVRFFRISIDRGNQATNENTSVLKRDEQREHTFYCHRAPPAGGPQRGLDDGVQPPDSKHQRRRLATTTCRNLLRFLRSFASIVTLQWVTCSRSACPLLKLHHLRPCDFAGCLCYPCSGEIYFSFHWLSTDG